MRNRRTDGQTEWPLAMARAKADKIGVCVAGKNCDPLVIHGPY